MIEAVVTDIEGTTSSLSFVKDVLFPYARAHIRRFVLENQQREEVQALLNDVRREMQQPGAPVEDVIGCLISWIDQDKKATPLKDLQGMIWEQGYRDGSYRGHVYRDAAEKLRQWHAAGVRLYIYSSGSVQAQKLLFAHTEYGDLTPLFNGYFDTTTGHKREVESYRKIAQAIGLPAEKILFLSDIREELEAAETAGMEVTLLDRTSATGYSAFPRAVDFDQIRFN
ncbi:MAG TPA: acireductone synthase [Gammaproteobacteria bacterium]|nr:acireductone synthase [Gammaproteobacteria bacterium]